MCLAVVFIILCFVLRLLLLLLLWRGVSCRGVAWRGAAWYGVVWRGVAWYGVFYSVLFCSRLCCIVLFCTRQRCCVLFCNVFVSVYSWIQRAGSTPDVAGNSDLKEHYLLSWGMYLKYEFYLWCSFLLHAVGIKLSKNSIYDTEYCLCTFICTLYLQRFNSQDIVDSSEIQFRDSITPGAGKVISM